MSDENPVLELRVALTVADLDAAVRFYREGLGMPVAKSWDTSDGRGFVLEAGRATLELIDEAQARFIDRVEVGERVAGAVRLALEFADVAAAVAAGRAAGASLLNGPLVTPWNDRNARLVGPEGMQLTFFQLLDGGADDER